MFGQTKNSQFINLIIRIILMVKNLSKASSLFFRIFQNIHILLYTYTFKIGRNLQRLQNNVLISFFLIVYFLNVRTAYNSPTQLSIELY